MATLASSSPSALQPITSILNNLLAALVVFGQENNFPIGPIATSTPLTTNESNTTSPLYLQWRAMTSLVNLLLINVTNGQSLQRIQLQGGSLYALASQYYADITQAFTLMSFNDLPTPRLSDTLVQFIELPPAQTATPSSGVSFAQVTP